MGISLEDTGNSTLRVTSGTMQASEENDSNGMGTKSRVSSDTESIRKGKRFRMPTGQSSEHSSGH